MLPCRMVGGCKALLQFLHLSCLSSSLGGCTVFPHPTAIGWGYIALLHGTLLKMYPLVLIGIYVTSQIDQ